MSLTISNSYNVECLDRIDALMLLLFDPNTSKANIEWQLGLWT